jgi:GT2 family glycosyltransferase
MRNQTEVDISVVLVGLNASGFIEKCCESLIDSDWHEYDYEIIYVDNGSSDNTLEMLGKRFPDVITMANEENLGFCVAANNGGRIAKGRYIFFLNDDTIVLDDAIAVLADALEKNPDIGIIGSRLLYPDMTEQWSGRKFPSALNGIFGRRSFLHRCFPNASPVVKYLYKTELSGTEPFEVDWVSAAAMMVRHSDFFQIGGFAEDYYYWHEPIICNRMKAIDKAIALHPCSKIIHYEGYGSGPRPYKVKRFHIINFHTGAYRCYCEHYQFSKIDPRRWLVATLLTGRALILLMQNRIVHTFSKC